eukprot:11494934-Prorocentrum_lima.AAC.1
MSYPRHKVLVGEYGSLQSTVVRVWLGETGAGLSEMYPVVSLVEWIAGWKKKRQDLGLLQRSQRHRPQQPV